MKEKEPTDLPTRIKENTIPCEDSRRNISCRGNTTVEDTDKIFPSLVRK